MKFICSKPHLNRHPVLTYFFPYLLYLTKRNLFKKHRQKLSPLFLKTVLSGNLELFFAWMCYKNALDDLFRKKKTETNKQLIVSLSGLNNSWKGHKLQLRFLKSHFMFFVWVFLIHVWLYRRYYTITRRYEF